MPLDVAKVTFSFAQGVYGWTENYYLNSPSSNFTLEFAKAEALAAKRIKISGLETTIPYIKISRENVKRDVIVYGYNYSGQALKASDAPTTALLFRRYGDTPVANSPIYLRGIWDELIIAGGQWDQSNGTWWTKFSAYQGELINEGWGFVARDPAISFNSQITGVTQNLASGTVTITVQDAIFTQPAGTKFKAFVSAVQGAAAINGSNVFKVTTATTATTVKRIPIFAYLTGGKLTYNDLKFYDITQADIIRVVERKVGRPLYVSRGRRPARRVS